MTRLFLSLALPLSLAACGGGDSGGTTTTKLDAVEVEPGTISDSMIILDDSSIDGTAVDNSVPDDGSDKTAGKKTEDGEDPIASESQGGESENPDAVPAPAAKKAVKADPEKAVETD